MVLVAFGSATSYNRGAGGGGLFNVITKGCNVTVVLFNWISTCRHKRDCGNIYISK